MGKLKPDNLAKGHRIGNYRTPTYYSWYAMNKRCYQTGQNNWPQYGGKGVTVCDRWRGSDGLNNFIEDLGERPEGKTLGRYGDVGNYEPSNVAWMTNEEQAAEKRKKTAAKKLDKVPATV